MQFIGIQTSDPVWYQALMTPLTPEQTKELEDVFKLAEQRRAAAGKGDNYLFWSVFIKKIWIVQYNERVVKHGRCHYYISTQDSHICI